MSDRTLPPVAAPAPSAGLEPDAISVTQDTLIGLADTGPTVSIAFSLVLLISATAYGAPLILLITAIPMLIIANAYRRLNLWNANCGASFEWVGRAINPYSVTTREPFTSHPAGSACTESAARAAWSGAS
jgi:amino acid transporter